MDKEPESNNLLDKHVLYYILNTYRRLTMNSKLTLKLNKDVIEKAKIYAHKNNISLSKMVEKYFLAVVKEESPT
jgi:hypothetical protein